VVVLAKGKALILGGISMHAQSVLQRSDQNMGSGSPTGKQRRSLADRLPRRSLRQVLAVPLSGDDRSSSSQSVSASKQRRKLADRPPQVDVAAIPASDGTCRHHLFVEDGTRLKKLDLPATASVVVSQRFEARAGDTLTYNYVVQLQSSGGYAVDRPAVRAVLVNRKTESAVSLMNRSIDGHSVTHQRRAGSRFRDSQSFTVPTTGYYELRFITFVDRNHPGCEAHLLVNAVRVVDSTGQEVKRLASLSCVGRVQNPAIDESVN
jgi:hypothetical protein